MVPGELDPTKTGLRRDPLRVFGLLLLLGTMAAARGVGNFFPLSVFPMYSEVSGRAASKLMVRVATGAFFEVSDFVSWRCPPLPVLEGGTCHGAAGIDYLDRDSERWLHEHPGAGGDAVLLVRRRFLFEASGAEDFCEVARCTAVRR